MRVLIFKQTMPHLKHLLNFFFMGFLFFLFISSNAKTETPPLEITEEKDLYRPGTHLDILEDPTGQLTFEQIKSPEYSNKFKRAKKKFPNFGMTKSSIWIRFRIKDKRVEPQKKEWVLAFENNQQDYIHFYKKEKASWKKTMTGDQYPLSSREVKTNLFMFKIYPGADSQYYLNVKGILVNIALSVGKMEKVLEQNIRRNNFIHLFLGFSLSLAVFNFFLYFFIRKLSYLYYSLTLFIAYLMNTNLSGNAAVYYFPNSPFVSNEGHTIFSNMTVIVFILFLFSFLNLKNKAPFLYKVGLILIINSVIGILIYPFSSYRFLFTYGIVINLPLMMVYSLITTFYLVKLRYRPAYFLFFGGLFVFFGIVINLIAGLSSLIPWNFFTINGPYLGMIAFQTILTLGLADRFKIMQEDIITKEKEAKENLQSEVDKQTLELKNKTIQLEELDKKKTHFFQNISHELRTPLTLIMNPLEIIKKRYKGDEEVEVADKNSKRLYRLVNQLLDFQKLSAGKKELDLKKMDVLNFLNTCADMFRSSCTTKQIDFRCTLNKMPITEEVLEKTTIYINGEVDALEKIVFNYLSNALKYSPPNHIITLNIDQKDGEIKVSVTDQGEGISEENQKKLFQVFSQVDDSTTRDYEGTGLGLALVKDLAAQMNGEVGVDSEVGRGSSFWLKIPEHGQNTFDYLAVDDEKEILELYEDLFDKSEVVRNYKVTSSTKEARELIQKHQFKVILCDAVMPEEEGLSFLEWCQTHSPDSKRLLVTGNVDEEILRSIVESGGIQNVIFKPWNDEEILMEIENIVPTDEVIDLKSYKAKDWHITEEETGEEEIEDTSQGEGKETVLIVDDLRDLRNLISKALKNSGYRTLTAKNGEHGLEVAKQHKPDLVISDWMMPKMSGPEMIKELKAMKVFSSLPVVLLTAKSDEESKLMGVELGADGFLGKPFNDQELVSVVRNLLSLKKREREVEALNYELTEKFLKRYLPPDLVEKVVNGEMSIEQKPEAITGTILFSDLVGFTNLSGELRANKISRLLNEYLTEMVKIIYAHEGTIDKFIGDAIMVIFGAPTESLPKEQAKKAADCAKAMHAKMIELNERWKEEEIPELKMRIGIHNGPLVVGTFGCPERSDYTSIGPTVNIASRIESVCEAGETFVSGEFCDLLPEEKTKRAGKFELKGISGTQTLYKLT